MAQNDTFFYQKRVLDAVLHVTLCLYPENVTIEFFFENVYIVVMMCGFEKRKNAKKRSKTEKVSEFLTILLKIERMDKQIRFRGKNLILRTTTSLDF